MKPGGGGKLFGELLELINRDFGSFEAFVKEFKAATATQLGSGWAWLASVSSRLEGAKAQAADREKEEEMKKREAEEEYQAEVRDVCGKYRF
ncbi:hypothetical protein RND71_018767 [Anisodus tanguticus]|uniref:Manganese/iron superoxide dismutase C-terminal domain-containing protein n=1 Tax=Anisodus tanguticus TaxID=243964 RepID=A0AAE1S4X1_9SOLA|nr:hypothetical protein RND71_018767 [Anisodus tanguticus]